MIFLVISDAGIDTKPVVAESPAAAAEVLRQRFAFAGSTSPANFAVVLPQFTGIIAPGANGPTLTFNGDSATQQTILNAAKTALANNQTYLGLATPTTAQAVTQVAALTRQMDGLIRTLVGDFTGTT